MNMAMDDHGGIAMCVNHGLVGFGGSFGCFLWVLPLFALSWALDFGVYFFFFGVRFFRVQGVRKLGRVRNPQFQLPVPRSMIFSSGRKKVVHCGRIERYGCGMLLSRS